MKSGATLVAVALLAALTGSAHAAGPPAAPPPNGEEHEEPFAEPVQTLQAIVTAHHGRTYKHPGYTTIALVSTPDAAYMTATEPATHTKLKWLTEETAGNTVTQPWECSHPNQRFVYTLTARANVGATVTTTTRFQAQLTARWCARAKNAERLAEARHAKAEAEREQRVLREAKALEERERAERVQPQRELEQWEANCRRAGGHIVQQHVGDAGATAPYCYSSTGVPINVPT
jgi:hypothetical protein